MEIRPIKTEQDYEAALEEIESLLDAEPNTPESDRLEILAILVENYEEKHYPVAMPDPIEAIKYHVERLGLSRRALEHCIGSRARVSEILNRKRPLTLKMIRALEQQLGIPAQILVQEYELGTGANTRRAQAEPCDYQLELTFPSPNSGNSLEGNSPPEQTIEPEKISSTDSVWEESSAKPILVTDWPVINYKRISTICTTV